ncbi:peptidoglycan DD-metalloendopeptidase family protein [Tenacibaculum sp. S7007]|uniref:Peptidoglycan DD-metalloendopeptidase family protein n=1 Tax=Tenacibaculum pelagium TaxID=2759527 RepID=A0A839AN40_9FLAO|nr:peptidoglycan DD-metalloendopeptidase family protein [Tenacibaculum pelagium]MBA6156522.1 peptidoglycan DD-metalloendopeptidase family protein [Tenacibaculum pelagium]
MIHFEDSYNKQQYGKIYNRFTSRYQKNVSRKKWDSLLIKMKDEYGKINHFTYIETANNSVRFNVNFEKGNQRFKLYPDNQILNKLGGLVYRDNPYLEKNISKITLPFDEGIWYVTQGGDSKKENNHYSINPQKKGFDFVLIDENKKAYNGKRSKNENYYSFGKNVLAPVDGEVISVIDGIKDNQPGHINRYYYAGNSIILKTKNNEFLFFGNLKKNSIKVKSGDIINKGKIIAQVGNSGRSYYPHLHFHIQNIESINSADGVKCYFDKVLVNNEERTNYSPTKGDLIQNK